MLKGEIVLIPFPFTDLTSTKMRPALILAASSLDITVCFITGQTHLQESTDVLVKHNSNNGLKKDSLIKVSKIATLDKSLAIGLLGYISSTELTKVEQSLKTFFQLP
jgi:mRNA interferase MazF